MHEFALCQSIVDTALQEFQKASGSSSRIVRVRVVVGELRQVVPETMQLAFEVLTKGTPAEGAALELVRYELTARCAQCSWKGALTDAVFICPACGGRELSVVTGKELYVDTMEVEDYDENNAGDQSL